MENSYSTAENVLLTGEENSWLLSILNCLDSLEFVFKGSIFVLLKWPFFAFKMIKFHVNINTAIVYIYIHIQINSVYICVYIHTHKKYICMYVMASFYLKILLHWKFICMNTISFTLSHVDFIGKSLFWFIPISYNVLNNLLVRGFVFTIFYFDVLVFTYSFPDWSAYKYFPQQSTSCWNCVKQRMTIMSLSGLWIWGLRRACLSNPLYRRFYL